MIQSIASPRNPLLKDIRRAASRGSLTSDGCAVAESFHLLEEALRSDCEVPVVVASEGVRATVERYVQHQERVRVVVLSEALFAEVASTESSQGVIALVKPPAWTLENLLRGCTLLVALDGVQDPGNAGTIVRAAEAFGATGVAFLKGSASPHNPKTLRASAGSLFRLPFVHGVDSELLSLTLAQHRVDTYAAMPAAQKKLDEADLTRRCALIVGSEGRGVSEKLRGAPIGIQIPTIGVESLNAAMAAAIILYEASRQRRIAGARA